MGTGVDSFGGDGGAGGFGIVSGMKRIGSIAAAGLAVAALAGCGGSEQEAWAKKFTKNELSIYQLKDGVSCSKAPSDGGEKRWACSATVVRDGVEQKMTMIVRCGSRVWSCSRLA